MSWLLVSRSELNELFKAMVEFSLPGKLRLAELTLENVRCEVKTQNGISDTHSSQEKG
jgi:hypothetical protein